MFQGTTFPVLKRLHQDSREEIEGLDKATLDGLAATGFKLDEGPDGAGFFIKYLERGWRYLSTFPHPGSELKSC